MTEIHKRSRHSVTISHAVLPTQSQRIKRHDKHRIEYEPPPGWSLDGGAQVKLKPPQRNFAEAVIEALPLTKPQLLDEAVAKTFQEQFIAALPPGSQFVTLVSAEQNPILRENERACVRFGRPMPNLEDQAGQT